MASSVLLTTGAAVAPGDVIFSSACRAAERRGEPEAAHTVDGDDVSAAEGCYVRVVTSAQAEASVPQRQVVAARLGTVQWEGSVVRVFSRAQLSRPTTQTLASPTSTATGAEATDPTAPPVADGVAGSSSSAPSLGPRPGDTVHVRVVRVARLFVMGEIIAIRGNWCSTAGSTGLNAAGSGSLSRMAFRGVLRLEDIRPFRPTKEQLQPPPPSSSYQPGDVVLAEVISQSDARQYQLSTCAPHCGVVESYLGTAEGHQGARVKLQIVPGRREVMVNPADGSVVPRWCPLVELAAANSDTKRRRL